MKSLGLLILFIVCAAVSAQAVGADSIAGYEAKVIATAASGKFAPHYMASGRSGVVTSSGNALLSARIERGLSHTQRFAWGFGVQAIGGYSSGVSYGRYNSTGWGSHNMHPSRIFIQQLYGGVKWRSLSLSLGMQERGSGLVDDGLSSGDLIHSANARPIPQARLGFIDYQPVPFTKGFLQVQAEFAYGKFTDSGWRRNHADYYNSMIVSGIWYVYRKLYFRTDPSRPFSAIVGVQAAGQFGGSSEYYNKGELVHTDHRGVRFKDFIKMIVPYEKGKEDFVQGNTLGSWDIKGTYRFRNGMALDGYIQWPWEDGSGMAKLNGFDGLYGLAFTLPGGVPLLRRAVVEYLDLTNQSGPMHWAPSDYPGTLITTEATGADDYYNNKYYGAYANYGMILGNPMVMSTIYNLDGYNTIIANRVRGFHVGAEGFVTPRLRWSAKIGYRKAYGNGFEALLPPLHATSALIGASWNPANLSGLTVGCELALDRGSLPANSFGALLTLTYSGIISAEK